MAVDTILALFSFFLLCNAVSSTSLCSLDFKQFPFEARTECLNQPSGILPEGWTATCCQSALEPVFQAMAIRANHSQSIFLDPPQAVECTELFQNLHNRTDLSSCRFPDFLSLSTPIGVCSRDVNSIVGFLGGESFGALQSNCGLLRTDSFSDDACLKCTDSYKRSLEVLEQGDGGKTDPMNRAFCSGALLVTLASFDVGSSSWVDGLFSCLWDEIRRIFVLIRATTCFAAFHWPQQKQDDGGLSWSSKILLTASIFVAVLMAILTPILYKITRKKLNEESKKEMEDLSVNATRTSLEYDQSMPISSSSGFYIFSHGEIAKAINGFNTSNLIGGGSLGKVYMGLMPSGQKVAVKRVKEEMRLPDFTASMSKVTKIRHPNLVTVLGYCDKGEQCLVYEYCAGGNLANRLLGKPSQMSLLSLTDPMSEVLTWEQRLRIASGIARGLWFLQNNLMGKMIHGDLKLTNILLNEKLEAKLSDYALTQAKNGTSGGSIDHESLKQQDDKYSFGVVLLQLLTGRDVMNSSDHSKPELVNEARALVLHGGDSSGLADPRLNGVYNSIAFQRVLLLAIFCTASSEQKAFPAAAVLSCRFAFPKAETIRSSPSSVQAGKCKNSVPNDSLEVLDIEQRDTAEDEITWSVRVVDRSIHSLSSEIMEEAFCPESRAV
ncbi:protein STRUBBELIG-RECEPTOR FAMILY 8-like [Aristolochia californica]|uniref:protein STRUBBELIG-RECEPTOR FAMILY 8-like n=1 Tax=Aristolochia californica TaxID=171875 RepID=UPI0035E0E4EF